MNTDGSEQTPTVLDIARSIQILGHSTAFENIKEYMERIVSEILKFESLIVTTPTLKAHPPSWHLSQIKDDFTNTLKDITNLENEITNAQQILAATPDQTKIQVINDNILTIAMTGKLAGNNLLSNLHQRFLSDAIAWIEKAMEQNPSQVAPLQQSSEEDTSTSHDSIKLNPTTSP
jgi:hypothetical protein